MNVKLKYSKTSATSCMSNILWDEKKPMRGGKFPPSHPVKDDTLDNFRKLGYWASCFPEGDGIAFNPKNKSISEIKRDIEKCFGWIVTA